MSFGAGGLAQMTYNHNDSLNGGLNSMSASGSFASRGANMKRLSIMTPAPSEEVAQAPKSSRAQLLAGLRTAPKGGASIPGTAPATQSQFPLTAKRQPTPPSQTHLAVPQTATASSFAQAQAQAAPRGHHYTPSQVMSPPAINLEAEAATAAQLDPDYYQQLLAMNQHLAQQQERLKQQLIMVTQQAQQMGLTSEQAQYYAQMMASQAGLYNQQMQLQQAQLQQAQQQQPIIEPVANQPGLFMVYNPMTGQTQYMYDQNAAQMGFMSDMGMNDHGLSHSPPPATPTYKTGFEPATNNHAKSNNWRSNSPPKHTPTPPREEPMALPPPSANAYRPGHKKTGSLMPGNDAPLKSAGFAPAGNFGPGQNREGEHPMRQPRGPPSLDELIAKPTSHHEGSKNFASRQRRAAINNIISAAGARRSCGSSNASSPTSERDELVFSSSAEDNDTASIRSGSSAQRAIGSEKKEREERESRERDRKTSNGSPVASDDAATISLAEKLSALNAGGAAQTENKEKRRSAVLLMKGAGQRRGLMF